MIQDIQEPCYLVAVTNQIVVAAVSSSAAADSEAAVNIAWL